MSTLPSGAAVITLGVDRSRVDEVLAELRQGITIPARFDVAGQPSPSGPPAPTPLVTFARVAEGVIGQPTPPPASRGTSPSPDDPLSRPIPLQLDLSAARGQLQQFAAEVRAALSATPVVPQPTPPPSAGPSRIASQAVAAPRVLPGGIAEGPPPRPPVAVIAAPSPEDQPAAPFPRFRGRPVAQLLSETDPADIDLPGLDLPRATPPRVPSEFRRDPVPEFLPEPARVRPAADRREAPTPPEPAPPSLAAAEPPELPPRPPTRTLAAATPAGDEGDPRRPPVAAVPVRADLDTGRITSQFEAFARSQSFVLPVTAQLDARQVAPQLQRLAQQGQPAAAVPVGAQGPPGRPPTTPPGRTVSSEPDEAQAARDAAAARSAPRWAAERFRETGRLPTREQVARQFGASPALARDALADARDEVAPLQRQQREERAAAVFLRQQERAQERAARAADRAARAAEREADDADREQARPPEGPAGPTAAGRRRQAGSLGGLRGGGVLNRYLGVGFIAREVLGVVQDAQQYRDAVGTAEGPADRVRAELGLASAVGRVPILGQAVGLLASEPQYQIQRTLADAQRQDQRTQLYGAQEGARVGLADQARNAGLPGFGVQRERIAQEQRDQLEAVRQRTAQRSEANARQNEAQRSAIDADPGRLANPAISGALTGVVAPLLPGPREFALSPFSGPLTTALAPLLPESLRGNSGAERAAQQRDADLRAQRNRDQDEREKQQVRAANAARLGGVEVEQRAQRNEYGYRGEQARLDALPLEDREAQRRLERRRAGNEASLIDLQGDTAAANRLYFSRLDEIRARDVQYSRQTAVAQVQIGTQTRQAAALAANDPFSAQVIGVTGQTQANLIGNRNPALIAPFLALGAAQLIQEAATAGRTFVQQRQQQGYQQRQTEALLARNPLQAQIEGINAQQQQALDVNAALPIPQFLKPILARGINTEAERRRELARQQEQQQRDETLFGLREQLVGLDLVTHPPGGNLVLGGLLARTQGVFAGAVGQAYAAYQQDRTHPEIPRAFLAIGEATEEANKAEFLRGLRPHEADITRSPLAPIAGQGDTMSQYLKDIAEKMEALGRMREDLSQLLVHVSGVAST